MFQIGLRRFYYQKKLKMNKLLEYFAKKNCKKQIKKSLELKK